MLAKTFQSSMITIILIQYALIVILDVQVAIKYHLDALHVYRICIYTLINVL